MPPVGFEPMISACERPQIHALDRVATGTGYMHLYIVVKLQDQTFPKIIILKHDFVGFVVTDFYFKQMVSITKS